METKEFKMDVRSALTIIPPKDICDNIDVIRSVYDDAYGRWMPHSNIIFPYISEEDFLTLREQIEKEMATIEPFEVQLNKFGFFGAKKKNICWLAPETDKDQIRQIYDKTIKYTPYLAKNKEFNAHITLGNLPKQETQTKLAEWSKTWKPTSFVVDRLYIITRVGEEPFKIKYEIKLGKN